MTISLRFFILALTPLLGVTGSLGPAFLFGLVATLLLAAVAGLAFLTRRSLHETGLLWSAIGLCVVLVTLVDAAASLWLPGVRTTWGIYLNLLAFSPLIVIPFRTIGETDFATELVPALKTGFWLTVLLVATAFVREALGRGSLTLVPGRLAWDIPGLKQFPLTIVATGAGGFFLAAAGVVAFRFWGKRDESVPESETNQESPRSPLPPPAAPASGPAALEPESGEWGETLAGVVADFASWPTNEKRRLLVIGSGNGELTWYLAMLCLDQARANSFPFRVRGVDHFSTRVETALRGVYKDHQIEFFDPSIRDAWMIRGEGEDRYLWRVAEEPRLHVQFEVADFQQGQLFFPQPTHLIVLNQGIEYVIDDKKVQLLKMVCDQLLPGGALVVTGPFKRELLPEGMKRTGTTVFRKA